MNSILTTFIRKHYVCSSCAKASHIARRKYASDASNSADIYDIVCIGGGPAGLSLLTALKSSSATSHLKVGLIESQDLAKSKSWNLPSDRFSNRASSLTATSLSFLSELGVWKHMDQSRVQPYQQMQVWDGLSDARIQFDWASTLQKRRPTSTSADPHDRDTIAYMTENPNLIRALLTRISSLPRSDQSIFDKTTVSSITQGPPASLSSNSDLDLSSWPHISLSSGKTLAARLLVGADGINSPVRTFANITSRGWDYDRHGVVATVSLSTENSESPKNAIAYQRFLPTGPIALLPLPGPYATLVWSTTPAHATFLKQLDSSSLSAMINAAFRLSTVDIEYMFTLPPTTHSSETEKNPFQDELDWRTEHTPQLRTTHAGHELPHPVVSIQPQSVASFPLRLRHADTYSLDRIALLGDAAHTIHPLAGQGLNLALGDSASLASTIQYAVTHGADLGNQMSLEAYGRDRYAGNARVLGVVDKLHSLYGMEGPLGVSIRSLGLRAVASEAIPGMSGIRGWLMGQAEGRGLFG